MGNLATNILLSIFVVVLVAFLLIKYQSNLEGAYSKLVGEASCEASVRNHALLKLRYADFSGEINCPTTYLKIKGKNQNEAKREIADAMVDCWKQYGKGDLQLFADDSIYCAICHRITLDKDARIDGFMKYLSEEKVSGKNITYLKYLTTQRTENSEFLKSLESQKIEDSLIASQHNEYAIVFSYIKGKKYIKEYSEKAAHMAPGAGLMIFGVGLIYTSLKTSFALASVSPAAGPAAPIVLTTSIGIAHAGTAIGTITFGVGALWSYLAYEISGVPFEHIALINFVPYNAQYLESLNCKEIPVK